MCSTHCTIGPTMSSMSFSMLLAMNFSRAFAWTFLHALDWYLVDILGIILSGIVASIDLYLH